MTPGLISPAERDYIIRGGEADMRADGRTRLDSRQMTIETTVISHASGSARLRVHGGTDVLVGVKVEIGTPDLVEADGSTLAKGDKGKVVCNVECSPSASQQFEGRGADDLNNELTQLLSRVLSGPQSGINLEKLCIIPQKACWVIYVDALVLDYGGNLLDSVLLAARSALHNTRVPVTTIQELGDGSGAVDFEIDDDVENAVRLEGWENIPVGVTFCTMRVEASGGQIYVVDCTPLEELSSDARVFIAVNRKGHVVTIQKGAHGGMAPSLLTEIIQTAKTYAAGLIRRHDAALNTEEAADNAKRARGEPVTKIGFFA